MGSINNNKVCKVNNNVSFSEFKAERDRLYGKYEDSPLAQAFLTFQEWLKTYKEDDDMWIPEVGEECEYNCPQENGTKWQVGKVVGKDESMWVLSTSDDDEDSWPYNAYPIECLRPIQSEEDKLVEMAWKGVSYGPHNQENQKLVMSVIRQMVDAGWRPIKPMTEDGFVEAVKNFSGADAYMAGCRFLEDDGF